MVFFILSNANLWFAKKKLIWRSYSTANALFTIVKIMIIDKKEFLAILLNKKNETFVMYIIATSIKANLNGYLS